MELSKINSNKKLSLYNIYRPPKNNTAKYDQFMNELTNNIKRFDSNKKPIIITGDFNINLLEINKKRAISLFFDSMISLSFLPKITLPTRLNETSASLIDNFYCKLNSDFKNESAGIVTINISDHLPYFFSFNFFDNKTTTPNLIKIKYKCFNSEEKLKQYLTENLNNFESDTNRDPNINYEKIDKTITEGIKKFYGSKYVKYNKRKHKKEPWMTNGILVSTLYKNRLYRKLKETNVNSEEYNVRKINLKTYKRILKNNILLAKQNFYQQEFIKYKNDIKQTWITLNLILNSRKKDKNLPDFFNINGKKVENSLDIANAFNTFFANLGPSLASKIPDTNNSQSFINFLNHPSPHNLKFEIVSEAEVSKAIDSINSKSSSGFDGLSTKLLKSIKNIILKPITLTINQSLKTGIFPSKLKISKIIPLFKKDDKHSITNYRPISLLPAISKIFEKIILTQITSHFNTHKLFFNGQYGFRTGHSTELAALDLVDKITQSLDSGNIPFNVYIDLSKAFETIDHKILLYKLKYYGFNETSLKLLENYLLERKQYVHYNNVNSKLLNSSCGVPQGSILGPLLFIIYTNDLHHSSSLFNFLTYADDTTLFGNINSFKSNNYTISQSINKELTKVNKWLELNKLSLNTNKTKFMIFSKQHKKIIIPSLAINNKEIENVQSFNFLGIEINQTLTWCNHINKLAPKISRTIGVINKLRNILPQKILIMLYNSLILPQLNYGILLWGYETQRLFRLQKQIIRIICNKKKKSHSSPLFKKLSILKLKDIFTLCQMKFFYKLKNNLLPPYFDHFHPIPFRTAHSHNTRQTFPYIIPRVKNEFAKKCLYFSLPGLVGSFPRGLAIRASTHSLVSFGSKIKNFFVDQYEGICSLVDCYICQQT